MVCLDFILPESANYVSFYPSSFLRNLSYLIAAQIALLMAGIAMLCFGVWRGEAATVLSKAIKLCLECVGIG